MDKDCDLSLLEYKIKLLHTMVTSMDNFKFDFYSFVIDHNINNYQSSLILKSLMIFDDRLENCTVSDLKKSFCEDYPELIPLIINSKPTYSEFKGFIDSILNVNVKYLLDSLKRQGIHSNICEFLLDDLNKNVTK